MPRTPPSRSSALRARGRSRPGSVRVRWDRVAMLAALVSVVVLAITYAVAGRGHAPQAAAAARGAAVAAAPAEPPRPCGAPRASEVRTAPIPQGAPAGARTVALTFDDGPGPWTPKVLKVLQDKGVHATFFVIGRHATGRPDLLRTMVASGHEIGDHTWSHIMPSPGRGWKAKTLAREISRTRSTIVEATGHAPCLFRPPGGVLKGAGPVSRAAGLSVTLWSVDTRDWDGQRPSDAARPGHIEERARAGLSQRHPVILLHDGGGYRGATVAALPRIVDDYRARGYQFVTMDGRS